MALAPTMVATDVACHTAPPQGKASREAQVRLLSRCVRRPPATISRSVSDSFEKHVIAEGGKGAARRVAEGSVALAPTVVATDLACHTTQPQGGASREAQVRYLSTRLKPSRI